MFFFCVCAACRLSISTHNLTLLNFCWLPRHVMCIVRSARAGDTALEVVPRARFTRREMSEVCTVTTYAQLDTRLKLSLALSVRRGSRKFFFLSFWRAKSWLICLHAMPCYGAGQVNAVTEMLENGILVPRNCGNDEEGDRNWHLKSEGGRGVA